MNDTGSDVSWDDDNWNVSVMNALGPKVKPPIDPESVLIWVAVTSPKNSPDVALICPSIFAAEAVSLPPADTLNADEDINPTGSAVAADEDICQDVPDLTYPDLFSSSAPPVNFSLSNSQPAISPPVNIT